MSVGASISQKESIGGGGIAGAVAWKQLAQVGVVCLVLLGVDRASLELIGVAMLGRPWARSGLGADWGCHGLLGAARG